MSVLLLIFGIVLFIGLVIIHEMGHFIAARRNGVDAEEFGLFFPPRLWSVKVAGKKHNWRGKLKPESARKPYIFSINLLPLGGFTRLKGEHDADTAPHSFGAASTWTKTKIMVAGVVMNLLAALVLFTILAWIGMPKLVDNQFTIKSDTHIVRNETLITFVQKGSPADKAGLEQRDQIISIAPPDQKAKKVESAKTLRNVTQKYAGKTVIVSYKRGGELHHVQVKLLSQKVVAASDKTNNPKGYLGVGPSSYILKRSTWSAPIVAVGLTGQFTALTFQGLGKALAGVGGIIAGAVSGNHAAREQAQTQASSQVSGPVGIYYIMKSGTALGYQFMLMIIAVISLTLAIMNILPIPALDGGKVFVTYVARAFKKRASESVENWVYGTSFVILLALIALISVVDVKRFF